MNVETRRLTPIRAELRKSRTCIAEGVTVNAYAPVLEMCRELVGRGHNPARPLRAYRGDVLCLKLSSIGWGAQYTVRDNNCGTPTLHRRQATGESAATTSQAAE
jgi:hypothetical protein